MTIDVNKIRQQVLEELENDYCHDGEFIPSERVDALVQHRVEDEKKRIAKARAVTRSFNQCSNIMAAAMKEAGLIGG